MKSECCEGEVIIGGNTQIGNVYHLDYVCTKCGQLADVLSDIADEYCVDKCDKSCDKQEDE